MQVLITETLPLTLAHLEYQQPGTGPPGGFGGGGPGFIDLKVMVSIAPLKRLFSGHKGNELPISTQGYLVVKFFGTLDTKSNSTLLVAKKPIPIP